MNSHMPPITRIRTRDEDVVTSDGDIRRLQKLASSLSAKAALRESAVSTPQISGKSIKENKDLQLIDAQDHLDDLVKNLFIFSMAFTLCFAFFSLLKILVSLSTLGVLVVTRHFYLIKKHPSAKAREWIAASDGRTAPDLSKLPATYFLYVFGSGGHTTEMIAMLKLSMKPNSRQHRRYIMTSRDSHSMNQEIELEAKIHDALPDGNAGTYDTLVATRARAVHQSYPSSIITSLKCALEILVALTKVPNKRARGPDAAEYKYPHVIVTNGPGTGFIVCLMAHILKVLFLAPDNRLKIVFVETWARSVNFGLTGKLFYWTNIADLFVVQSNSLSKIAKKPNMGNVNMRFADVRRPVPSGEEAAPSSEVRTPSESLSSSTNILTPSSSEDDAQSHSENWDYGADSSSRGLI